eukprot:COSAG01_NODE_22987_length_833_cov_1.158038_1_plen_39_part_10
MQEVSSVPLGFVDTFKQFPAVRATIHRSTHTICLTKQVC